MKTMGGDLSYSLLQHTLCSLPVVSSDRPYERPLKENTHTQKSQQSIYMYNNEEILDDQ